MLLRKIYHFLIYLFVRTLYASYRLEFEGVEHLERAKKIHPSGSFIFAVWHEHFLAAIYGIKDFSPCAMCSPSKDGDLVANFVKRLGYTVARGSSSRGGLNARNTALRSLEKGTVVAITVDGPKGPKNKCKPGVIHLAKTTGCPILPIAPLTKNPKVFHKSWDKSKLPKPFSKIILRFGPIIEVEKDCSSQDFTNYQSKLDNTLNKTELLVTQSF